MKRLILCVAVLLVGVFSIGGTAGATIIPLYQGSGRIIGPGPGEGRWTFFELLNDVTITQVGAVLEPTSSAVPVHWGLFSTNSAGDFASFSLVYETTDTYDLLGLQEYDTDFLVSLTAGFYTLGLTTPNAGLMLDTSNNILSSYPNPTIDGNFRVLGGASSHLDSGTVPLNGNNLLLPKFRVNIQGFDPPDPDPNVIPEPSSLIVWSLILVTFGGVGWWRRWKH